MRKLKQLIVPLLLLAGIIYAGERYLLPLLPSFSERKAGTSPTITQEQYWTHEISLSRAAKVRFKAANAIIGVGVQNQKPFDFYVVSGAEWPKFDAFQSRQSSNPPQFLVRRENVKQFDGAEAQLPAGKSYLIIDNSTFGGAPSVDALKVQYSYFLDPES